MTMMNNFSTGNRQARRSLNGGKSRRNNDRDDEIVTERIPDLRSLVLPWATLVVLSTIAATVVYYKSSLYSEYDMENESDLAASSSSAREGRGFLERLLSGSSQLYEADRHHVHRPVFEENHPPLFPLSASDKLGFALTIVGLMIAAGGGIGGGGIIVPIYILVRLFECILQNSAVHLLSVAIDAYVSLTREFAYISPRLLCSSAPKIMGFSPKHGTLGH